MIHKLENLMGENGKVVVDFYKEYQPYDFPMLSSYVKLLAIEDILQEDLIDEPGVYLSELGVYAIASTVGGHLICVDTNDMKNGEPSVLLIDSMFCSFNHYYKRIEIGLIPENVLKEIEEQIRNGELFELTYQNLRKCIPPLADSYHEFMEKLSKNEYDDIEDYLVE